MSRHRSLWSITLLSATLLACTDPVPPGVTAVDPGSFVAVEGLGGPDGAGGGGASSDTPGGAGADASGAPGADGATGGGAMDAGGGGTDGPVADATGDGGTAPLDGGGAVVDAGGDAPHFDGCNPGSCASAGAECGKVTNGCGGTLDCGGCPEGKACGTVEPNRCGEAGCVPTTCAAALAECGVVEDGCGGTLDCGTCPSGEVCGVETPNRCGCTPITCATAGIACGVAPDGCGGMVSCGGCPGGVPCVNGACGCTPSCAGKQCGGDGCGGSCGSCNNGASCSGGQCVKGSCGGHCGSQEPVSCGNKCQCYCDAVCFQYGDCCDDVCTQCGGTFPDTCCTPQCGGKQCGDDGCGGSCGSCGVGFECASNQCAVCQPKCDGKVCGGDGCGGSCGGCEGGTQCGPEGQCLACVPDCKGMQCGDDGCGGSCGTCETDCSALPPGPFQLQKLSGPMASEDLGFDADGNVVGSNDKAIFRSKYGGSPQLFVPNFNFRAGMRFLPSGDLLVNKDTTGQLVRIAPDGTQTVVLNNLAYPNGMAVDQGGFAWVTEHDADRVLRVDPYAKTYDVIAKGTVKNPNGICFSPDYTTVYVAGFSGVGTIYAFPVNPDGTVGQVHAFATKVGTGWLDGIGVDVCGNLYIADYYATKIYRFPPDGSSYKTVVDGSKGNNVYLPNMDWGSGIGGWDAMKLYLPDGWNKGVFEVDVGVPGKPRVYP